MPGFGCADNLSPNRIECACAARRQANLPLLDLTDTNPTRHGYLFPPKVLSHCAFLYWEKRLYQPEARGSLEARQEIVKYYSARQPSFPISCQQVFLTSGSSESYSLLFSLLCEPGDNILAPQVTYPLFDLLAAHHRLQLKPYKLIEERGWDIDEQSLLEAADNRTRAALIISPHNPTGNIQSRRLEALAKLKIPIICDEIFAAFCYACAQTPVLGALYPELPVFHLNGISKMFALPDLKLGWIALNQAAEEAYADRLELLNDLFLSANSLVQSMLPSIFAQGQSFMEQMQSRINENVSLALSLLQSSPQFKVQPPDGAYFLFPKLVSGIDEEEFVLALIARGGLVHPGYFYGEAEGSHIMISCLPDKKILLPGVEKIIALAENC